LQGIKIDEPLFQPFRLLFGIFLILYPEKVSMALDLPNRDDQHSASQRYCLHANLGITLLLPDRPPVGDFLCKTLSPFSVRFASLELGMRIKSFAPSLVKQRGDASPRCQS
jgi:hypothetical protein